MGIREKSLETMDLFFSQERDKSYSSLRNYDLGPNDRENVSMLSKYTRYRILLESELAKKSLSSKDNEKFVKEVYWRTYWKGYLQNRPSIWLDYKQRLSINEESQIEDDIHTALCGKTNIDCFDYWISELKNTGYLHNHARMWFASIWIHHLKLPWYKGLSSF